MWIEIGLMQQVVKLWHIHLFVLKKAVRGSCWRHLQCLCVTGEEVEEATLWLQEELEPCKWCLPAHVFLYHHVAALNWLFIFFAWPESGGGCQSWARLQDDKTQEDQERWREEEKQAKEASQIKETK